MPATFSHITLHAGNGMNVMKGSRVPLSFGPFSDSARSHLFDSSDTIFINSAFPTFRNERSDCLRTGLLSILHYIDPECRLDMAALREMLCAGRNVGTDIASAALLLSNLGIPVIALASSFERIPQKPLEEALKHKLVVKHVASRDMLSSVVYRGDAAICCVDPAAMHPAATSSAHGVLLTGFGDEIAVIHDSMRPLDAHGSHGEHNSLRLWQEFEVGRTAHDHHTLIAGCRNINLQLHRHMISFGLTLGSSFWPELVSWQEEEKPRPPEWQDVPLRPGQIPQVHLRTIPFVHNTGGHHVAAAALSAMRFHDRLLALEPAQATRLMRQTTRRKPQDLLDMAQLFNRLGYRASLHGPLTAGQKKALPPAFRHKPVALAGRRLKAAMANGKVALAMLRLDKRHHAAKPYCLVGYKQGLMHLHKPGDAHTAGTPYQCMLPHDFKQALAKDSPMLLLEERKSHRRAQRLKPSPVL